MENSSALKESRMFPVSNSLPLEVLLILKGERA
jgi:hypothetical protein